MFYYQTRDAGTWDSLESWTPKHYQVHCVGMLEPLPELRFFLQVVLAYALEILAVELCHRPKLQRGSDYLVHCRLQNHRLHDRPGTRGLIPVPKGRWS